LYLRPYPRFPLHDFGLNVAISVDRKLVFAIVRHTEFVVASGLSEHKSEVGSALQYFASLIGHDAGGEGHVREEELLQPSPVSLYQNEAGREFAHPAGHVLH